MMLLLLALYNQFIVWLPVCAPDIFLCGFLNVFIFSIWNQSLGPDASHVQLRLNKWMLTQWAKQLPLCCLRRKCLITAEYTHHHWWQHICIKVPLFWGDSYHLSKLLLFSLSPQSFYWISEQFQAISLQIQALFKRTALLVSLAVSGTSQSCQESQIQWAWLILFWSMLHSPSVAAKRGCNSCLDDSAYFSIECLSFTGYILISGAYFHYCKNLLDAAETDSQYKHTIARNICVKKDECEEGMGAAGPYMLLLFFW